MDLNFPPDGFDLNDPFVYEEDAQDEGCVVGNTESQLGIAGDHIDLHGITGGDGGENADPVDSTTKTATTGTATGQTISSNDSDTEDEVQSTPSQSTPLTPYPTMSFDSWEEAKLHYNRYANHIGFSIKISTFRNSAKDQQKDKCLFVCNKSGKNAKKNQEVAPEKQRNRSITKKTDCKARLRVKRIGARWQVTIFVEEHTHPCIKKFSLKRYLRSHRNIPREERDFIKLLHGVNLSTGRVMQIMSELYGCMKNVPYTTKDISNYKTKLNDEHNHKDMEHLLAYFEEVRREDPDFFYKLHLDKDDRVDHIFWVDGAARSAYKLYNDCISFDTTYLTNMYNMPCAPFIGINRYGQSILLGCGFMRNEKIENFEWLFRTFLEAMGGLQPSNIITDQDIAMGAAINNVFATTIHRNCRWHIMKKAQEKLGNFMAKRESLRKEFNEIVDYSVTIEESQNRWEEMIVRHDVGDNTHLRDIYDLRKSFVPVYFKDCFFPFLQTTARSEGFNAVLKKYVNPQNSILFFRQYGKIQEKIDVAEDGQEFEVEDKIVRLWSEYPMEEHAFQVYTRPIYFRFQTELHKITSYNVHHIGGYTYHVVPIRGSVYPYGDRSYIVEAILAEETYGCGCSKFYKDGLLCCHIMKVMTYMGETNSLPERYILPRWSNPPEQPLPTQPDMPRPPAGKLSRKDLKMIRYSNLCNDFVKIADVASSSDKAKTIAVKHMRAMQDELNALKNAGTGKKKKITSFTSPQTMHQDSTRTPTQNASSACVGTTTSEVMRVRDPPSTITKGRPIEKRKKSGLDLQPTRTVLCSVCSSNQHNSARCPLRLAMQGEHPEINLFSRGA